MKISTNSLLDPRPVVGALALIAATMAPAAGAPAVGDSFTYQLVNGYNKEILGKVRYQVTQADSNSITVSVIPNRADAGTARTEIYTKGGNWLQVQIESHGKPLEYRFAAAFPAYVFPLNPGKTWSLRVNAKVPFMEQRRSVRVDGKVLGTERIRVPAGEFDTIKIRRLVYPGDAQFTYSDTHITEFDWYAPALGRSVRTERNHKWMNTSECGNVMGCEFRGSWVVLELVDSGGMKK
jgi:hypothetical protein